MMEIMATPNGMANVKDWLVNRCRDTSSLLAIDRLPLQTGRQLTYSNVVVTPDNIPKFTIPSSIDTVPHRLCTDLQSQSSGGGSGSSISGSNGLSIGPQHMQSMQHWLMPTTATQCQSAPVSPMRSLPTESIPPKQRAKSTTHFNDNSGSNILGHTNSDPMSLVALSLPHLKMQTLYGFETLTESPHTRRKESLFHDDSILNGAFQGLPLTERTSKRKTPSSLETLNGAFQGLPLIERTSKRKTPSSLETLLPLGTIHSANHRVSSPQPYSCREHRVASHSCLPSLGVSPSPLQRHSTCSLQLPSSQTDQENWGMLKAPSSVSSFDGSSPCSSCPSFSQCSDGGSSTDRHIELGQVKLSLLYLPKQQQLKVGLIQAEHLTSSTGTWSLPSTSRLSLKHFLIDSSHAQQKPDQLNPYVKLCLMPGKVQRHVSKVACHTQNPVFNQDFVFNDLEQHKMAEMSLRLKVYHKKAKLGRNELLGELQVSMAELTPNQEMRVTRELEPVSRQHELGHIQISMCFHPSTEKLTVNVHKVTNLSKHTFTGAPDPYVRVELSQPQRSTTSQQTRTKKKNTTPVFDESFIFTISPKIEDLLYTSLTVTVLDHSTLWTDRQIGQVRLGFDATEEAEFHHWNQVLQQPDHVATNWHLLMDPVSD